MSLSIYTKQSLIFSLIGEVGEEDKEVLKEEFSVCAKKKEVGQVSVQNKSF